jgi:hypothetical protein
MLFKMYELFLEIKIFIYYYQTTDNQKHWNKSVR